MYADTPAVTSTVHETQPSTSAAASISSSSGVEPCARVAELVASQAATGNATIEPDLELSCVCSPSSTTLRLQRLTELTSPRSPLRPARRTRQQEAAAMREDPVRFPKHT
ncbi:hypothetical protein CV019_14925 [Staphylococcus haemolyticus]|uniref:Uncharacterized protein n=1 Tax=Staphylococcus haemolyticus TaxID=1283 RepID=A0A7Z1MY55_STAHA|nr:hypothetical protein CV019_14925 [Staphylococcus haemolyticus]